MRLVGAWFWVTFAIFGVLSGARQPCIAGSRYAITNLGDLPNGDDISYAYAINASGQVAGQSGASTGDRAFLWTPTVANGTTGSMINLGDLPGGLDRSYGYGINDQGQVVGSSYNENYYHGFLWTPTARNGTTGSMIDLGELPGGTDQSEAHAINSAGHVTGFSYGLSPLAFLWTPTTPNGTNGSMVDLGGLPGGLVVSYGQDINVSGQVVGVGQTTTRDRAFLWTPTTPNGSVGAMVDLGTLPSLGQGNAYATAINSKGQVAGQSSVVTGGNHAFLWTPQTPNGLVGSMIDLGTDGDAADLNDLGQVVGYYPASTPLNPYLWTPDNGLQMLNSLIDPDSGWSLFSANGINDAGQIVGSGYFDPDGPGPIPLRIRGYLLTPVPEPAGMCCISLMIALLTRRRRS